MPQGQLQAPLQPGPDGAPSASLGGAAAGRAAPGHHGAGGGGDPRGPRNGGQHGGIRRKTMEKDGKSVGKYGKT